MHQLETKNKVGKNSIGGFLLSPGSLMSRSLFQLFLHSLKEKGTFGRPGTNGSPGTCRGVRLLWGDHTSQACCTYYPGTTEWKLRSQGKKWINETHSNAKITHFSWYCNSYNPNYIFLGSSFKILLIGTRFTWPWRNYISFDRKGIKRTHKPLTD